MVISYFTLKSLSITLVFGQGPDAEAWLENAIFLHMKICNIILVKENILEKCYLGLHFFLLNKISLLEINFSMKSYFNSKYGPYLCV